MLKKTALALPLALLAVASSSVFAAGEATSVINIKALDSYQAVPRPAAGSGLR
jgi:hypothetical protein